MNPLVDYARKGLRNCYMEDRRCWSYIYHLDGRAEPNQSLPAWDVFYSLNVILGLAKAGEDSEYDLPALLQENAKKLFELPVPTYAFGTALWASAQLGVPLEAETAGKIGDFIRDRSRWLKFRAQDAGMILTGLCEQQTNDEEAHALFRFIKSNYLAPSGLFYDEAKGFRRDFASFATQTYLTAACYHYGVRYGSEEAFAIADAATRKLLTMQGPNGEWPWFYYPPRGIVVDNYEIYSVHQNGMAPLFLSFAEQRGIPGAREAIVKGFEWVLGKNQLNRAMMVPELGMFYRSIVRQGELTDKRKRMKRAIYNGLTGRPDSYATPEKLSVRLECRSYELGWILYSFGARTDLPAITHHPDFIRAIEAGSPAAIPVQEFNMKAPQESLPAFR